MFWIALAMQATAPVPFVPPPGNIIATGLDFEMDGAIAPAIKKYSDCMAAARSRQVGDGTPQYLRTTNRAIRRCRHVRSEAMAEADVALGQKPAWGDPTKRAAEINAAFDNTDASARKLARETDEYFEAHFSTR